MLITIITFISMVILTLASISGFNRAQGCFEVLLFGSSTLFFAVLSFLVLIR